MAPGGMSRFCDDCGYQACLEAGVCLEVCAQDLQTDPQDLVLDLAQHPRLTVCIRPLPPEELEALERHLREGDARDPIFIPAPRHE